LISCSFSLESTIGDVVGELSGEVVGLFGELGEEVVGDGVTSLGGSVATESVDNNTKPSKGVSV